MSQKLISQSLNKLHKSLSLGMLLQTSVYCCTTFNSLYFLDMERNRFKYISIPHINHELLTQPYNTLPSSSPSYHLRWNFPTLLHLYYRWHLWWEFEWEGGKTHSFWTFEAGSPSLLLECRRCWFSAPGWPRSPTTFAAAVHPPSPPSLLLCPLSILSSTPEQWKTPD